MTIPETARRNAEQPTYVGGYADVAHVYLEHGWSPPLPLPKGQKFPPPTGFTGGAARIPTPDEIETWRREKANGNVALYLAEYEGFALLGVDIDNYAKGDRPAGRALEVIAEVEKTARCTFPPTFVLRNRTDGSEKRLYRVPCGVLWRSKLGPGVELIHWHHRYVSAGINPDTGNFEQWYDSAGRLLREPPRPQDFAEMPDELVDELRRGNGAEMPAKATEAEAQRLLDNLPEGAMSESVGELMHRAQRDLGGLNGSRHDVTLSHIRGLMTYGAAGLTGTATALELLKHEFVEAVWSDPDHRGTREIAGDEFDRMVTDGARRVAALAEGDLAGWAKGLKSLEPGGLWYDYQCNGPAPASGGERVTRSLADVTPAKVTWLWYPWIPLGKVSILEGEPGEGKSLLTLVMTALVTTGSEWPMTMVNEGMLPRTRFGPAGVVLVGVEDDEADTIVPRLDAAGANRRLVHTINQPTDDRGNPKPFLIPEDIDRLRCAIGEVDAKLIVIDPLTAFLSTQQVKAGDDPSTRQALMPLVTVAAETGCAVVLVRHLNKATGMAAKHRGSGTIAYTGITRSVMVAGRLKEPTPDGATHAIARTKGNLSKEPKAIGYRLDSAPDDPDAPVVEWCGPIDLTADQLVGADGAKVGDARKNAPVRDECERVLAELLADGPMPQKEAIKKTRDAVDCSPKSVREAADRIGVVKKPVRVDNKIDHWTWELPPKKLRLSDFRDGGDERLDTPGPLAPSLGGSR